MQAPIDRLGYSAIVDRPALRLPNGAKVVVWPIVNVEVWDIERPMPRQILPAPSGPSPLPDVPNWAWHEYGMRVGFWRLLAEFERRGITPTLSINAKVCDAYPRLATAARDAGWEFMGHGYVQRPMHSVDDERAEILKAVQVLTNFCGHAPRGWLGPGLTETLETPDLLAEAGIEYVGDWVVDDEPCRISAGSGSLVAMPYPLELNDITMMLVQHHTSDVFARRVTDHFERLLQEGAERAKVMAIAVHPYISGVPHRIKYLEQVLDRLGGERNVMFWTGGQILDWYHGQSGPT
jgi:allantoinase